MDDEKHKARHKETNFEEGRAGAGKETIRLSNEGYKYRRS